MDTLKQKIVFFILLVSGLSGMVISFFSNDLRILMNSIVPIPKVFVENHYLYEKRINVYSVDGKMITYNLKNEAGWPFRPGFLIQYYTLLDSLDRPHLVNNQLWHDTINYYFCENKSIFKKDIQNIDILKIESNIKINRRWLKIKEHQCSL